MKDNDLSVESQGDALQTFVGKAYEIGRSEALKTRSYIAGWSGAEQSMKDGWTAGIQWALENQDLLCVAGADVNEIEEMESYIRECRKCIRDLVRASQGGYRDHSLEIDGVLLAEKPIRRGADAKQDKKEENLTWRYFNDAKFHSFIERLIAETLEAHEQRLRRGTSPHEWTIFGQTVREYLHYKFPATRGHIPLLEWLSKFEAHVYDLSLGLPEPEVSKPSDEDVMRDPKSAKEFVKALDLELKEPPSDHVEATRQKELLNVVKAAYLKHHCGQDNVGWNKLSDMMCDALCNAMGDVGFQRWLDENTEGNRDEQ